MRAVLVLVALTACGRIEFDHASPLDAPIDAVTGHDEDGDGIPDDLDNCPQLAAPLDDMDADGVGDACDPHPTTSGDRITVFSPMTPGTVPFDPGTVFTQEADAVVPAADSAFFYTHTIQNARVEFGFEITALGANPQKQVATGFEGSDPFYFVELTDDTVNHWTAVVSYDMTNGYVQLATTDVPTVHLGRGVQRIDVQGTGTPSMRVLTGWFGELYDVMADTPAYTSSPRQRFIFNGVDIRIEYLLVIESP